MVDFKSENMSSESYYPDSDFYNQDNQPKETPSSDDQKSPRSQIQS